MKNEPVKSIRISHTNSINYFLKKNDMTQVELAKLLNRDKTTINRWCKSYKIIYNDGWQTDERFRVSHKIEQMFKKNLIDVLSKIKT